MSSISDMFSTPLDAFTCYDLNSRYYSWIHRKLGQSADAWLVGHRKRGPEPFPKWGGFRCVQTLGLALLNTNDDIANRAHACRDKILTRPPSLSPTCRPLSNKGLIPAGIGKLNYLQSLALGRSSLSGETHVKIHGRRRQRRRRES